MSSGTSAQWNNAYGCRVLVLEAVWQPGLRPIMRLDHRTILILATGATVALLGLWLYTGRAVFTHFQLVGQQSSAVGEEDPLAATGFYGADSVTRVTLRDEFGFGLLPAGGPFDRHVVSVTTMVIPIWILTSYGLWRRRRPERAGRQKRDSIA